MLDIQRNHYAKIQKLLQQFPVVAILGARQTGKTTLAKQLGAQSFRYLDMENPQDYERLSFDPVFFFQQNQEPMIIDEAQEYPDLFKVLRGVVDSQRDRKGRFLLTGSASPKLLKSISESLSGRIALVELGTLKANEQQQKPLSPIYQWFETKLSQDIQLIKEPWLSLEDMQRAWFYGGYPEPVLSRDESFFSVWMENYRKTYVERDTLKLFPGLNYLAYQRFINILCKLSGTIINKSDIGRAVEVSEGSIRQYLTIADGTFLWQNIESFEKNIIKSIIKMPKGYIRDSGFLHHLLKLTSLDDLYNNPVAGRSFEAFAIEEIIKGLSSSQIAGWRPCYYRTRAGAEIDLILDGPFGVLPIEIKLGSSLKLNQLKTLSSFIEEHSLAYGILVNQGEHMEWISKNILQVPINYL